MNSAKNSLCHTFSVYTLVIAFAGLMLLSNCDSDQPTGFQYEDIDRVVISPESAEIAVGEQVDFTFFLLTETGDTINKEDFDIETEWWSTDPEIFSVEENGLATGHQEGEEYCIIDATILKGESNFTGRDSAIVFLWLFRTN